LEIPHKTGKKERVRAAKPLCILYLVCYLDGKGKVLF